VNPVYVPLLSALAGALIGSLSSIAVILIQARIADRRERLRQAASLAVEEYKIQIEHSAGARVLPFSSFLYNTMAVLQAIEEKDYTPERLRKISADNNAIFDVLMELDDAWQKRERARKARQ
jgi:hypothetical protein